MGEWRRVFDSRCPDPKPKEELAKKAEVLPEGVGPILGQLVLKIGEAHRWAELAFRKVDGNDRITVARRYNVGEEMVDAFDYCPAIDDVAAAFDEAKLHRKEASHSDVFQICVV